MNKVILMGRLTRDPEVRYSQGATATAVARFSVAVDRRFKREGEPDADFFNCTCFGKQAEFVEKYLHKGTKVVLTGRIQNDNYTNKEGQMVQMPYRPMQRPAVRTISFAQLCSMSRAGMADEVFRRRAEMEFALNEFKMQRIAMMNSRHADMTL